MRWLVQYLGAIGVGLLVGGTTTFTGHHLEAAAGGALVVTLVTMGVGSPTGWAWGYSLGVVSLVGVPALASLGGGTHLEGYFLVDDTTRAMTGLVALVFPMVVLAGWSSIRGDLTVYWGGMILLEGLLLVCFGAGHLLVFYIVFEALAVPMFVQVGRYGSNLAARRGAALKFLLYTVAGSTTALPGILLATTQAGGLGWATLVAHPWTPEEEVLLAAALGVPFLVKIPVVPFHLWLVEAHVEAPAPSSMVLAALLLKTGGVGYLRWVGGVWHTGEEEKK